MKVNTEAHIMEYNSDKEKMIIPEYGRNVQMLVNHAKTVEDDALRQAFAEKIIELMQQMHPQNRNIEDYESKLWKHLYKIANYEIDVHPPKGERPTKEEDAKRPKTVEYPPVGTRFRHYGNNVQSLINKAMAMEDGPKKDGFVQTIGNYMKLAYRTWNKEHYVSDEIIKNDLKTLSKGELTLEDGESLDFLSNANRRRKQRIENTNGRSNNGRNNGGRNNNRRNNNRNNGGRNNGGGRNNYRR